MLKMNGCRLADLGSQVRAMRRERCLTQEQLADAAELTQQTLSAIESGARSPSLGTLGKLATALGAYWSGDAAGWVLISRSAAVTNPR